jgi:hypothetical protein
MICFIRYTTGLGNSAIFVRLRNSTGQYYNWTTSTWVSSEVSDCRINLTERDDSDAVFSVYIADIVVPTGGPFLQEAVLASSSTVLGYDTTAVDVPLSTIKAKTDSLSFAGSDVKATLDSEEVIVASDSVTTIQTGLATGANLATVDTVVDAIKAKTDNLPSDPASNTLVNTKLSTLDYIAPENAAIIGSFNILDSASFGLSRLDIELDDIVSKLVALDTLVDGLFIDRSLASEQTIIKADLTTLKDRLTNARGVLLDSLSNLDATITSRASQVSMDSAALVVASRASQASVDVLPVAIDVVLSANHGDILWGSGSIGVYKINVSLIKTGDTTPIPGAFVTLMNSSGTVRFNTVIADEEGLCSFNVDAGDYKLIARKDGVTFVDEIVTVDTVDVDLTIEGDYQEIPLPPIPELQNLYGYVFTLDRVALSEKKVTATPTIPAQHFDSYLLAKLKLTDYTDVNGMFSLTVIKGSSITLDIKDHGTYTITVSDKDVADVVSYLA